MVTSRKEEVVRTKHFKGTIFITDPCYICKEVDISTKPKLEDFQSYSKVTDYPDFNPETGISQQFNDEYWKWEEAHQMWYNTHQSDWVLSGYGSNFENLGITNYMTHDTLYGDWGCTVFETETKRPLGEFCADAGLVSVFLLDEVLKYNPEILDWAAEHPWCATVIPDFDGDVEFVIVHREGTWDETTDYWNKGDPWEDDILIVRGTGNVNFFTTQTSL